MARHEQINFTAVTKAVDEGILARAFYTGSETTATIEVAAAGNVILITGSTTTTFTVATAAYDTLGELRDGINGVDGWHCQLVGGLTSDSSNNSLITLSATSAKKADNESGVDLLIDTSVAEGVTGNVSNCLGFSSATPFVQPYDQIDEYVDNTDPLQAIYELDGEQHQVSYLSVSYTASATDTASIVFLSVDDRTGTATTLYATQTISSSDTSTFQFGTLIAGSLNSLPSERLAIRMTGGDGGTVYTMTAHYRRVPRNTIVSPNVTG